jgi:hypothetical protein
MSRSLDILLKLAQRRIDALAIEAADAARRMDEVLTSRAAAAAQEEKEAAGAAGDILMLAMLPAYRARMAATMAGLDERRRAEEALQARVRTALAAAYQEKSKLEQLIEMERQRRLVAERAKEQAALDEAALNLSNRSG